MARRHFAVNVDLPSYPEQIRATYIQTDIDGASKLHIIVEGPLTANIEAAIMDVASKVGVGRHH